MVAIRDEYCYQGYCLNRKNIKYNNHIEGHHLEKGHARKPKLLKGYKWSLNSYRLSMLI